MSLSERVARLETAVEALLQQFDGEVPDGPSLEEQHTLTVQKVKLARERGGLSA